MSEPATYIVSCDEDGAVAESVNPPFLGLQVTALEKLAKATESVALEVAGAGIDEDVAEEERRALSGEYPPSRVAIKLTRLRKVFYTRSGPRARRK